ncbi:hypothetical protein EON83_12350 [bacterium]|nr:MAG: hypothetical protein EON83_12350 [bacterium]
MSLTPEFLAEFQINQVVVPPTEVEHSGGVRIQSFWGFDSAPQASTKDWRLGNTIQIFEPLGNGVARLWEVNTSFGVPYDAERIQHGARIVPAFAVGHLDIAMGEMGYCPAEWSDGWPMLTYTLGPNPQIEAAILAQLKKMSAVAA